MIWSDELYVVSTKSTTKFFVDKHEAENYEFLTPGAEMQKYQICDEETIEEEV